MRTRFVLTLAGAIVLACLTGAWGIMVDLSGWWKVVEDNYQMIKIEQNGTDVAIYGTDEPVINGVFINDTLWYYFTGPPADTGFLVYADDTLRGLTEEGNPITLIKYVVDLTGWWRNIVSGGADYLKMLQQGSDVTIWDSLEGPSNIFYGSFANDTLLIPVVFPGSTDTTVIIMTYAYDILRGVVPEPENDSMVFVRMPYGLWAPIRCGTITVDGYDSDWDELWMIADDPDDDVVNGDPSADLDKLYLCHDSAYLYIRIDCVGEVMYYNDRYGIAVGRNLFGQHDYGVRIDYGYYTVFRNNTTGEETVLDNAGRIGRTVECRVPLYLLEYIDRANFVVSTAYYDWDFGWLAYDEINAPAKYNPCVCGDASGDGAVILDDAVYGINYIFKGGPAPWPLDAGDANCDHAVNIGDVVYIINYLFKSGPEPCCP